MYLGSGKLGNISKISQKEEMDLEKLLREFALKSLKENADEMNMS